MKKRLAACRLLTLLSSDRRGRSFVSSSRFNLGIAIFAGTLSLGNAHAAGARSIAGVDIGMSPDQVREQLTHQKYSIYEFPEKNGIVLKTAASADYSDMVGVMFVDGKVAWIERTVTLKSGAEIPIATLRQAILDKFGPATSDLSQLSGTFQDANLQWSYDPAGRKMADTNCLDWVTQGRRSLPVGQDRSASLSLPTRAQARCGWSAFLVSSSDSKLAGRTTNYEVGEFDAPSLFRHLKQQAETKQQQDQKAIDATKSNKPAL